MKTYLEEYEDQVRKSASQKYFLIGCIIGLLFVLGLFGLIFLLL